MAPYSVEARPPPRHNMNQLGSLDPALGCSGMMSIFSYDSHPVSRRRNCDELPRINSSQADSRSEHSVEHLTIDMLVFTYHTLVVAVVTLPYKVLQIFTL